jgi:phage/plasmid-like protein (TIGR03299 family)
MHQLETMAYVGATPWHGLGHCLTPHQPIEVWLTQAGMDWQIREAPVRFMTEGIDRPDAVLCVPDSKVLYRSDTHQPLSIVSQRFKVVQPQEILEFYRDLTERSGFELETAGVLHHGRRLWALAKTGQSFSLKGNDLSHAYVLLATACDGTLATTALFTAIRVVCNNTLAVALNGGSSAVKVPHNVKFDAQAVKAQLGISVTSWDAFIYRMKALSERPVNATDATAYFHKVFSRQDKDGRELTSERAMAKALALFDGQGKGAELASSKGTAYGLLNAVTQYVDHERRAKSTDHRLDSAFFGQGAHIKQKAQDEGLLLTH